MSKKIILLSMSVFLLIFVTSCRKTKLTGDKAIYEGYWQGDYTEMELRANGRADYQYDDGTVTKSISNGRLIIDGSTLKIKLLIKVNYHIDSPPRTYLDAPGNEVTTMTLDGNVFYKQ